MTTLWLTRGLPASGKTTWARALVDSKPSGSIVRLNRDDLRAMALRSDYLTPSYTAEELVSVVQHGPIPELLRRGIDVVVDDTNLRSRALRTLMELGARAGADVQVVDEFLSVPLTTCLERDAARARPVGADVIRHMHGKYLSGGRRLTVPALDSATVGKPYAAVPGAQKAIIVDIDGTVALHGSRSPYDTSRYDEDAPYAAVIEQIRMAAAADYCVLFTSGRDITYRTVTVEWLCRHVIADDMTWDIFMRPAGDTRNDAVVKLELFDEHIRDRFDVRWVLDDRDRVVAMWRGLGLSVMQVAPGAF